MPAGALAAVLVIILMVSGSGRVFSNSTNEEVMEAQTVKVSPANTSPSRSNDTIPASKRVAVEIRRSDKQTTSRSSVTDTLPKPPMPPSPPAPPKWSEVPVSPVPSPPPRSDEHTSELQSLMRISYAVFYLKTTTQKPH